MNGIVKKIGKVIKLLLVIGLVYFAVITIHDISVQTSQTVLFRKRSIDKTTSNWVINGRYSKDETECIENCIRQGGVNCGGVLYFACCASEDYCTTFPLGITRCSQILPDFRCFKRS